MTYGAPRLGLVRRPGAVQESALGASLRMQAVSRLNRREITPLQDLDSERFLSGAGCSGESKAHVAKRQVCGRRDGQPQGKNRKNAWGGRKRQERRPSRGRRRRKRAARPAAYVPFCLGTGPARTCPRRRRRRGSRTGTSICSGAWRNQHGSGAGAPVWKCCTGPGGSSPRGHGSDSCWRRWL